MQSPVLLLAPLGPDNHQVWTYWQAVEDDAHNHNWGLLRAPFKPSSAEDFEITKQYYAFLHFTRFIRPGCQILWLEADAVLASYCADGKALTIVVTNNTDEEAPHTFDLSAFECRGTEVAVVRTSETENFTKLDSMVMPSDCQLTHTARPRSITTLVLARIVEASGHNIWKSLFLTLKDLYWNQLCRYQRGHGFDHG